MTWIATYTGKRLDLLDPKPDQIDLNDIVVALARMPRFTGHTTQFYSVAQHSVLVAWQTPMDLRLQAVLHDATEAYLGDLARPIKALCPGYRAIEDRLWHAIAERFGVPVELRPEVRAADDRLLMTEKRDLLPGSPPWEDDHFEGVEPLGDFLIEPWSERVAHDRFRDAVSGYLNTSTRLATA